ncbi:hypothetical protein FRC11_000067 [Ceratobasidium sp. 423]|nr:hypothetical protein FRC11_000067 [Ceratobasidium sp. 423]
MSDLRVTTNQAHDSGFSTLCFSGDGKRLYTGGNDSLVRVWDTALGAEQEPQVLGEATLDVMSITCSDSSCYTASKDSSVRHYDATNEFTELVAEAAGLCVRCIALSPDSQWLAVCTEDTVVKIINTTTTSRVALLDGHKKGVRSVTWDPKGRYLTTCGQDGQIIVWDVKDPLQASQLNVIEHIIPAVGDSESPEFHYGCAAVWHPSGMYFAAVSASHDIVFVSASTWTKTETLKNGHDSVATSLTFSPNGSYLASGGTDNKVIVWDLLDKKAKWSAPAGQQGKPVTAIGFHPQKNMLAWMIDGALQQWNTPVPASHPHPSSTKTTVAPPKTASASKDDGPAVDDDLAGIDDDYGDDWIVDDMGDGAHLDEPREIEVETKEKSKKRRYSGGKGGIREMVNITKAQPPFQPGATAFRNKKRYMAYNMKGVIECTNLDVHYVINVEFHDRSFHQNIHFQDVNRFDLASLGEYGVAFSCPPDNGHFAMIEYRPYSEWSPNAQWQFKLPEGEEVIALAAAGTPAGRMIQMSGGKYEAFGMVAAATNRGYIRFISGGGVQEYIMSAAGDIVSMAGGKEWVFIVHREGGTSLDGCQNLRYSLVAVDGFDLVQEGRLPVAKGEMLKWIGVTTEGAPAMADSSGVLYVLDRYRRPTQARWVPVVDSNLLSRRVGKDETYWPVGLSSSQFHCIILKGRETEPGFPRPLVQDLEVRTPLLIAEQESGEQEEQLFREMLQLIMLQDSQLHEEDESEEVMRGKLSVGQFNGGGRRNGRQQYFDEFAPPPVVTRRSLATATPIVVNDDTPAPSNSMAIDETPTPVETKRKRVEEDTWDIEMEDDGAADFKRQNVQKADASKLGVSKSNSGNPFARKATSNPFAKKTAQAVAPTTKSTSFFDKVDAAESAGPKRGAKFAPKASSRQTTLFGLPAKSGSPAQSTPQSETNDGETQLEDPEQTQ